MNPRRTRHDLLEIGRAALDAVAGDSSVRRFLQQAPLEGPVYIVAVGKAASAMLQGALAEVDCAAALLITKYGHVDPRLHGHPHLEILESAHPVPDEASLTAGRRLLAFVDALPADARVLFLISGGASSLVECLPENVGLADLQRVNRWLLGHGYPIEAVNAVRKRLSLIKGGKLLAHLGRRQVTGLLISDVKGDEPSAIGSGLLVHSCPELPAGLPDWLLALLPEPAPAPAGAEPPALHIVACLAQALDAACKKARDLGYACHRHAHFVEGDAAVQACKLVDSSLRREPGVHLWGGETTVSLPPNPGRGGRNQAMALAAAIELAGQAPGRLFMALASDGTDGPTEDAGALVDGETPARGRLAGLEPGVCLAQADSGRFLEAAGDLIHTGPTGTNVMDIYLLLEPEQA